MIPDNYEYVFGEHSDEDSYLRSCLSVNQADLPSEYIRVSADYGYWAERFAAVDEETARLKTRLEMVDAKLSIEIETELRADGLGGTRGPSDKKVRHRVLGHQVYRGALNDYQSMNGERERLNQILKAIQVKKEMLISLGATMRQERDAAKF